MRLGRKMGEPRKTLTFYLCLSFFCLSPPSPSLVLFQAKIFNKLSGDPDRKIREAICETHLALVVKIKKGIAPHLKSVMGNWLCCMFDPNKEVSRLANDAFEVRLPPFLRDSLCVFAFSTSFFSCQSAFPPNKRANALVFCKDEIMGLISDNLIKETPESMSDSSATKEEIQGKYERAMSCSLLSFGYLVETLSAGESGQLETHYKALLAEKKFWGFVKSENPLVRRAVYRVVSLLCQKIPSILEPQIKNVGQIVLSLGDLDSLTHAELWDAALLFSKRQNSSLRLLFISRSKPPFVLFSRVSSGLEGD